MLIYLYQDILSQILFANSLLRDLINPIKPRVFEAVGSLGGADSAPLFNSFLTHPVDLKLCMTIVHSKMQKTDQFFFRKVTWYLDDVIIFSFCFEIFNIWLYEFLEGIWNTIFSSIWMQTGFISTCRSFMWILHKILMELGIFLCVMSKRALIPRKMNRSYFIYLSCFTCTGSFVE